MAPPPKYATVLRIWKFLKSILCRRRYRGRGSRGPYPPSTIYFRTKVTMEFIFKKKKPLASGGLRSGAKLGWTDPLWEFRVVDPLHLLKFLGPELLCCPSLLAPELQKLVK